MSGDYGGFALRNVKDVDLRPTFMLYYWKQVRTLGPLLLILQRLESWMNHTSNIWLFLWHATRTILTVEEGEGEVIREKNPHAVYQKDEEDLSGDVYLKIKYIYQESTISTYSIILSAYSESNKFHEDLIYLNVFACFILGKKKRHEVILCEKGRFCAVPRPKYSNIVYYRTKYSQRQVWSL